MREKVLQSIRDQALLRAGDRVAAAVSGGADSVALLRVLLELRGELGIVLSVAHFNHGLRDQAAADEAFVAEIAKEHELEFFAGRGNVRDHASTSKLSIEAVARELRYRWFASLAEVQRLNAVATAHTLDDQAETVLLKLLRGTGTRGLAGVYPVVQPETSGSKARFPSEEHLGAPEGVPREKQAEGAPLQDLLERERLQSASPDTGGIASSTRARGCRIVRPLLCVSRQEVESYVTSIGQPWREDESNLDRRFLRNRVRHELLPLLEREFNPNIRRALSDSAEIARGEEEFWQQRVERELAERLGVSAKETVVGSRSPVECLRLDDFSALPIALQRRLLKRFAEQQRLTLDYEHVERLRRCALGETSKTELPGGRIALRTGQALGLYPPPAANTPGSYRCLLPVRGQVHIAELDLTLRAEIVPGEFAPEIAPGELLSLDLVGMELVVRNWLPGDRFWPAHSRSEEKLKRLFAEKHIPAAERSTWPVVLSGEQIVWVRGFPVGNAYQWKGSGEAVRVDLAPSNHPTTGSMGHVLS